MDRGDSTFDVIVIGAGVIGLSIAYELSLRGLSVGILDRSRVGREASWAGAGILPPGAMSPLASLSPSERLRAVSLCRYPDLSARILEESGIDIGFRRTGGLEVARTDRDVEELTARRTRRQRVGIDVEPASTSLLSDREPGLAPVNAADWLPGVCQVRNPWLLRGLLQSCRRRGVAVFEQASDWRAHRDRDRVLAIEIDGNVRLACGHLVVAAGSWSAQVFESLEGIELPIVPVQGQILVFQTSGSDVRHIIFEGKRYLVPREDGLVLVGSTEDQVAFDKQVTREAMAGLRDFAVELFPTLAVRPVRYAWAGLRPASRLGSPILGRMGQLRNAWLATGHFRQGIQQAPATAELLADWITQASSFAREEDFSLAPQTSAESVFDS